MINDYLLRANNLTKSYKSRRVVNDISLGLSPGEIVGLLGPNGAGKTTLFYMLVGLVPCDQGSITLSNHVVTDMPVHVRAKLGLGYLPQEASVFRKLTVEENIKAILELRKDLNSTEREEKLDALLSEFHITHIRHSLAISLSGGERRRVEIARTLALEPKFILLDEPFAGIDPISVIDIKQIITHLSQKNIGVLITDHNVRETLDICQRAYIVSEGKILCEGHPKSILENKQVREVYLGDDFDL
ncbi:MAG: LPS export ABC transporter ATP-binding protein [Gammaproteobacteria bacterium]